MKRRITSVLILFLIIFFSSTLLIAQPKNDQENLKTRVVLLGTGTPRPGPDNSGPATAIVYGNRVFLFDAGQE